jgi:threonine aldolase
LTGKDDAVFVPSGTMANLSAIMGHGCYGGQVIVEASSHIYNSEGGGLSVLAGAVARPVRGAHGVMAGPTNKGRARHRRLPCPRSVRSTRPPLHIRVCDRASSRPPRQDGRRETGPGPSRATPGSDR